MNTVVRRMPNRVREKQKISSDELDVNHAIYQQNLHILGKDGGITAHSLL